MKNVNIYMGSNLWHPVSYVLCFMPYECFIRVKAKGNFFIFFILNSLQALVVSEFGVCMQLSKQFRPKNVLEKTQLKFCVELSSPNFCPQRHSPWLSAVRCNWIRRVFLGKNIVPKNVQFVHMLPAHQKPVFQVFFLLPAILLEADDDLLLLLLTTVLLLYPAIWACSFLPPASRPLFNLQNKI